MTFILFLQISHYDANYVYDAYSAVESKLTCNLKVFVHSTSAEESDVNSNGFGKVS